MPLYEFYCEDCDRQFDAFKLVHQRHTARCTCGKDAPKIMSMPSTAIDGQLKDQLGTPVWYPKHGGTHYDRILKQTFHSKREKVDYMKEKGLVMDGSSDPKNFPIEAGDMRSKSYRKQVESED